MLLQALYSIRSKRQLMERIEPDLLFRPLRSADLGSCGDGSSASKPRVKRLLSSDHFSVDGTLVDAWASMKSFRPKEGSRPRPTTSFDEMDEVSGAGSAELRPDGSLQIQLEYHLGDEAVLKAVRAPSPTAC